MRYVRMALYREELHRRLAVHGYANRTMMDCEHCNFIKQAYISERGDLSIHDTTFNVNLDYRIYKPNVQSTYHHHQTTLLLLLLLS